MHRTIPFHVSGNNYNPSAAVRARECRADTTIHHGERKSEACLAVESHNAPSSLREREFQVIKDSVEHGEKKRASGARHRAADQCMHMYRRKGVRKRESLVGRQEINDGVMDSLRLPPYLAQSSNSSLFIQQDHTTPHLHW